MASSTSSPRDFDACLSRAKVIIAGTGWTNSVTTALMAHAFIQLAELFAEQLDSNGGFGCVICNENPGYGPHTVHAEDCRLKFLEKFNG